MKIVAGSDWRDGIPFETPVLVADLVPGEPTRCFSCGVDSDPRPRTELWAVKHRHPKQHSGFVRFYCAEHRPSPPPPPAAAPVAGRPSVSRPRAERAAPTRRPTPSPERPKALCPNCFVEVPATGVCGICGERIG